MTIRHLLVAGAAIAALSVGGCAVFQASPSTSTCATTANDLAAAQTALTLAQGVLAAIEAGQPNPSKTLTQAQADFNAAQTLVNTLTSLYAQKCGTPPTPSASLQQFKAMSPDAKALAMADVQRMTPMRPGASAGLSRHGF